MATKKDPIPVVTIDSSDDDDDEEEERTSAVVVTSNSTAKNGSSPTKTTVRTRLQAHKEQQQQNLSSFSNENLMPRSFWKAGNFEVVGSSTTTNYNSASELLEHARVHPKFLHSNATSHKWAFGAIAELLDNAIDEIHNGATFVKVDKVDIMKDNSPALLFQDDGGGMTPEGIRKCMSLGYSSKKTNTTIGQYGNGFKTSTMRLGADVIVLSRAIRAGKATQSVGLLSYTFLRKTGLDDIVVPMIDFDISSHWAEPIIYGSKDDWSRNLNTILEWSPFSSKDDLLHQFEDIGSHGTKIIIYNLWLNDEGVYELSFDDDEEDIRLRDETNRGDKTKKVHYKVVEIQSHISYRLRYSLRAYASVLYLRKFTNFKILLRGKPVEQFNIADELQYSNVVTYKPQVAASAKEETVETTIGFMAPHLGITGYNVYHKNRLIRPFWKVTAEGQSKGYGVVGVLEVNFIEPAHDKQDFERSSLYIRLEAKLKQMLMDYWKGHCHLVGYHPYGTSAQKNQKGHSEHTSAKLDSSLQKQIGDSCGQMSVHERLPVNPPLASLESNVRLNMTGRNLGSGGAPTSQKDISNIGPVLPCASVPEATLDGLGSMSVDQICEENVQLFMRCEEHKKKETELKQLIQRVEKELDETRKRSAQLSSYIENQKKQKTLKQQMERI